MITMYTIHNDEIVNRRFYKNNTEQTREHYISTLRRHFVGNFRMLKLITDYREQFVYRNQVPFDDHFTFVVEHQFVDGVIISDTFYSYNFDVDSNVNLTLVFPHDDYQSRKIFQNEVLFYLDSYNYLNLKQQLGRFINDFINDDSEYMYVEKHKFSMRNEDD